MVKEHSGNLPCLDIWCILNAEERPVKTIYSLYTENSIFYDKSHYFKIKKGCKVE